MTSNADAAKAVTENITPLISRVLEKRIGLILDEIEADVKSVYAAKSVVSGWVLSNRKGVYDQDGAYLGFYVSADQILDMLKAREA